MQSETRTSTVEAATPSRRSVGRWAADVLLFFASPFISLAYAAALPFVGISRALKARATMQTSASSAAKR